MPYGKNEVKNSNVNYVSKDFNDLKTSLINYTKSYFPNTYKDFNETSPGMMLVELSAYVGDVLNFYIDQQYREMLVPLSEDRRNLITLAKSQGYKVKAITPAFADITVKQTIVANDKGEPNWDGASPALTVDKGMQIAASTDSNLLFETLDVVDFKISSSADPAPIVTDIDPVTGIPSNFTLTRNVKAISGETKTTSFAIGEPTTFYQLTLPETNVIEVLKVLDSNGNRWYEVDTLAQDKVSITNHYTSDENRSSAYKSAVGDTTISLPVPYSLEYKKVSKRFTAEVGVDNKMILTFGNGILKNGNTFDATFLAVEQVGINLPGGEENMESEIDPLLGDAYGTLGEAPAHTTLTVYYRVGGGTGANIASGILTNIVSYNLLPSGTTNALTVTNDKPAAGGSSGETLDEIRHRTMGHVSTQKRCVTKGDFEARTLAMASMFGNIAKVYCARSGAVMNTQRKKVQNLVTNLQDIITKNFELFNPNLNLGEKQIKANELKALFSGADGTEGLTSEDFTTLYETLELTYQNVSQDDRLYTVDLYLLSYDNNKNLINTPTIVKQNLKQYLNQFRMITDQISIYDGYVINFGVVFDVVAQAYENKDEVKVRCIQAIKDYFTADKMQFKQILYTSDINQVLLETDGVRGVNYVTITQDKDYNAQTAVGGTEPSVFSPGLYNTLISSNGTTSNIDNPGYGYYYDFSEFYGGGAISGNGIILPAYEPAVFELKKPNENIKGIVR